MGVCHGDDVLYLFGFPLRLRGIVFTDADVKLSTDMIHAWTTFAWTGKPTGTMSNGAKWVEAVSTSKPHVQYMSLNATGYQMVDNYYAKSCESFWDAKLMA